MRMPHRTLGLSIALALALASQGAAALPFCKSKKTTAAPLPFLLSPGSMQQVVYYPVPVRPQASTGPYPVMRSPAYLAPRQGPYGTPSWPSRR
jgi:hypothetical protein